MPIPINHVATFHILAFHQPSLFHSLLQQLGDGRTDLSDLVDQVFRIGRKELLRLLELGLDLLALLSRSAEEH